MAEKWTIKGRIVVDHLLPELSKAFGAREGVPKAVVKVSARSKVLSGWGWWNSWGQVTTEADGSFTVSENHGGDRRQFKVEVLFDSDRLRLKEGQETSIRLDGQGFPLDVEFDLTDKDWFEVHDDESDGAPNGRQAGVIDLGDIAVTGAVAHRLADAWCLYGRVMDLLENYGPAYTVSKRITVKYPMGLAGNAAASSSYSNPVNRAVYIKEGQFTSRTLIHEFMHQWDYDHSTGEDAMAWQLAKHGSTHQARENTTFVPFREAFADWVAHRLLIEITGGEVRNFIEDVAWKYPELPLARTYVGAALADSEQEAGQCRLHRARLAQPVQHPDLPLPRPVRFQPLDHRQRPGVLLRRHLLHPVQPRGPHRLQPAAGAERLAQISGQADRPVHGQRRPRLLPFPCPRRRHPARSGGREDPSDQDVPQPQRDRESGLRLTLGHAPDRG